MSEQNQPLVSMMIPSFNHGRYVRACIESLIAQDYENIELIIIDDGSTDNSVQEIKSMVPTCITRFKKFEFRYRPNKGLAATLNEAIEWSSGTYFAAIASDDLLYTKKTASLVAHLENDKNVAGVFSGCDFIDEAGSVIKELNPKLNHYTFDDVITRKHVLVAPSQLLRLNLLKEVGGYPEGLYVEDWYMWLAFTYRGYRLKVVPDRLVQYRQHESNISKNAIKMFESRKLILSYFTNDSPLYRYAKSLIYVMAALDFSCHAKQQAATCLIQAVSFSRKILLTRNFYNSSIRLFVPCSFIQFIKRAKS